ncbi:VWA domain-containing protein, partial [bacterium]|nr:VWA domain-containing protein [bacterium]
MRRTIVGTKACFAGLVIVCLCLIIVIPVGVLSEEQAETSPTNGKTISESAESEIGSGPMNTPYSLTISVKLVNLFVTVVDRKGHVIKDLKKADFQLWEDDIPQTITHFATHVEAPLSIAVLIDISGSMALMDKYKNSCEIIRQLIGRLKAEDEMALFTFADGIIQIAVPFTRDKSHILQKLEAVTPYGKTALYWAVDTMPHILGNPSNRQAIVLLTDGIDNLSEIPLNELLENIKKTRLPIYTLNFASDLLDNVKAPEEYARLTVLRQIAQTTGGNFYEVGDKSDLPGVLSSLTSELRYQYLLGYNSSQKPEPGAYH